MPAAVRLGSDILSFLAACGIRDAELPRLGILETFRQDLEQANRVVNLTRITSPEDYWLKHVADSLSLGLYMPDILRQPRVAADIGFGGGFPLIPLAWANQQLHITGFEAKKKRTAFVETEIRKLGFSNIRVVDQQAREAARQPEFAETFDLVIARAVKDGAYMVRHCRGLLRHSPAACLVLYKTPVAINAELQSTRREAERFGCFVQVSPEFTLPRNAGTRQFLVVRRQ
ncbi:MAG: class I SAM-dependent methyltransferase [Candidatus Pacebacteria bacterium]|nr:class I SAM-dependent methyltransferase [Candidatus Paceibacterota bacterium]